MLGLGPCHPIGYHSSCLAAYDPYAFIRKKLVNFREKTPPQIGIRIKENNELSFCVTPTYVLGNGIYLSFIKDHLRRVILYHLKRAIGAVGIYNYYFADIALLMVWHQGGKALVNSAYVVLGWNDYGGR